jgi:Zn-dependent protease with chaperone function
LAALPILGLGFLMAGLLMAPLLNGFSRRLESQADRFALD